MDWLTLRTAIRDAVMYCTQIPTDRVFWEGAKESTGWKGPTNTPDTEAMHATAELKIRQVRGYGRDEARANYTAASGPDPASRTVALVGTRKVTLQVKLESFRQSDGGVDAQAVADRLRTRWRSRHVRKMLQAAELGTSDIGPTITADFAVDKRQKSCAILEIPLWAVAYELDTAPGATDWIETVRAENEDGSEVVLDTGVIGPA